MVSAITERPYTFLRWLTGTLPGRRPLRRTCPLRATKRASAFASRSDAGTLIWNSCFNPSVRVSVTCMASIFFRFSPAQTARTLVSLSRRGLTACAGGRRTHLSEMVLQQSSCKRCQRLVRAEGLEPPQLSSLEPKSSASTSSATPADSIMSGRDAAGGRAYNMGPPAPTKKIAIPELPLSTSPALDITTGTWSASVMTDRIFRLDRRELVAGLGAALLSPATPGIAAAEGRASLVLRAQASVIGLRPGGPETPIWSLQGTAPDPRFHFKRGPAPDAP